jgi:hypothetical protein
MLRVLVALIAVPFVLVLVLAAAMDMKGGELGSLTRELFELGPLPIVMLVGLVLVAVFLPLLYAASRIRKVSCLSAAFVGFSSALLTALLGAWPVLSDSKLRWNFRLEQLVSFYPWLTLGVFGGMLFWLLALYRNNAINHSKGRQ